jgi:hypothetical protein
MCQWVSVMTIKTTLIASLGAVAIVLSAGVASADPGGARGAGVAPARPGMPAFPRNVHRGTGFFPATGGVYYGAMNDVREPVVEAAPAPRMSDELRYTCVLDIPWDYVHRCPQYTTPR